MTHFYRNIYEPSEVAPLPVRQRRFVYCRYMHPLTTRLPVMLAKVGLWAVVLLIGWQLRAFESTAGFILLMIVAFAAPLAKLLA